jgi:hypothetical protein
MVAHQVHHHAQNREGKEIRAHHDRVRHDLALAHSEMGGRRHPCHLPVCDQQRALVSVANFVERYASCKQRVCRGGLCAACNE